MLPPDPDDSDLLRRWAEEDHLETDPPRRNWPLIIVAGTVVGLVALIVGVVVVAGSDDGSPHPVPQDEAAPQEKPVAEAPPPVETVPPGPETGLAVVDQGFTVVEDRFDDDERVGTFAAVIHNPHPEWLAGGVQVDVRFFDAAGAMVSAQSGFIEAILPDQRAAVAALFFDAPAGVTDMTVTSHVARWSETGPVGGSFEIRDPVTEAAGAGGVRTRLLLRSTYADELADVEVTAVYRDELGGIIGGSDASVGTLPPGVDAPVEITLPVDIPFDAVAFTELYPAASFEALTGG